jgi:hypothetical protein
MSQVQSWVEDIFKTWHILAISSVTALVLGYLYLFVIRIIGGLIIWLSIILIEIFLFSASIYTFYRRTYEIDHDTKLYDYMTWAGYAILALAVIVLIIMCCCWHAIKIGIAVFKTTSQYVQANMHFCSTHSCLLCHHDLVCLLDLWSCFRFLHWYSSTTR